MVRRPFVAAICGLQESDKRVYYRNCIKKRPDGLTNLPPGKVDAKADAAPVGATNREMRRPSLDTLEGFFYV